MPVATSPSSTELNRLLDARSAAEHLQARGLVRSSAAIETLGGGVSNVVLRARAGKRSLVLKQALPRLRVTRDWFADPERTITEARALRVAAGVDPSWVPAVVDLDERRRVLVIESAPPDVIDWKQQLMRGQVESAVAGDAGGFIARVHRATLVGAVTPPHLRCFDVPQAFEQLRIRPYFESVAAGDERLGDIIMPPVREMKRRRICLVHGDVSPKNVLVGSGLHWLIDWEVAHLGDPAFDVAFMVTHLLLKSLHLPEHRGKLLESACAFLEGYAAADGPAQDDQHCVALTGALLVARVDGRSPAEYLTPAERESVRGLGGALAQMPSASLRTVLGCLR